LDCLRSRFTWHEPEITVEANPDDVTEALVDGWLDVGINRVSLGVQSFDDGVLRYLGRRHGADVAKRACDIVSDRFQNWSLDLMFGAQPIAAWPATLTECARRRPPHFSAYGLTFEPSTPFGTRTDDAVDDETYLSLCAEIDRVMTGYVRYEISNYALPGMECLHNLHYWHNESYAGFGPGAYSYINSLRARNHSNLDRYLESPGIKTESLPLSEREQRVETLIQYLRLRQGLPKRCYSDRFGALPESDFGDALSTLTSRGLIDVDAQWIRPTNKGFELNNEIGLALVG
jgi:oxygen-independent coproporphyrinogen-3 oxidase